MIFTSITPRKTNVNKLVLHKSGAAPHKVQKNSNAFPAERAGLLRTACGHPHGKISEPADRHAAWLLWTLFYPYITNIVDVGWRKRGPILRIRSQVSRSCNGSVRIFNWPSVTYKSREGPLETKTVLCGIGFSRYLLSHLKTCQVSFS